MKRIISVLLFFILMLSCFTACSKTEQTEEEKTIKIGVIDTSISAKTISDYNLKYLNDIVKEEIEDDNTHGSTILNVIKQNVKNCEIYYSTALDSSCTGEISYVINSVKWCIENDVDIICMSFATTKDDNDLKQVIAEAKANNIILVASCINYSSEICYPAMYEGVISVSDGSNSNASIMMNYDQNSKYQSCSELTAFVCGKIAHELSKGNEDVFKILENIKEN